MSGVVIFFALIGLFGIVLYLGIWGGVIGSAVFLSRHSENRIVRSAPAVAFLLPVLLLGPPQIYMAGLCHLAGGLEVAHPIAGMRGLVIDPDTTPDCNETCHFLIMRHYAFVEMEVQPGTALDPVAEYSSRLFRFYLGRVGRESSPNCIGRPGRQGWCVARKPIDAFSTDYMLTESKDWRAPVRSMPSRWRGLGVYMRDVRLVDRRTNEILGSMTSYDRHGAILSSLADFFGLPRACPAKSNPYDLFDTLLEQFPRATDP